MFDTNKQFRIQINGETPKTCLLRFPTDEELATRARQQRVIRQNLGRGKTITKPASNAASVDAELFDKLAIEPGLLDPDEKAAALTKLLRADTLNVEKIPEGFSISLETPFGVVTHHVKLPKQKDVVAYRRASVSIVEQRRSEELRFSLEPGAALYELVSLSSDGYESAVPITHKAMVVNELLAAAEEPDDEHPEIEALAIGTN
jgi:hypothetical protein